MFSFYLQAMAKSERKQPTLRQGLLKAFSRTMFIALALGLGISLGFLFWTTGSIGNNSQQARKQQILQHSTDSIKQNGEVFAQYLDKVSRAGLQPVVSAVQDALRRKPYSMGTVTSYYASSETYLAEPITVDSRTTLRVSLSNSAFHLPNTAFSELSSVALSIQSMINASAHLDPFFRSTRASIVDILASFVGFKESGLHRTFPGKKIGIYDPRERPWFKLAIDDPSSIHVTEPYLDAFSNSWVMTVTRAILRGDANVTDARGTLSAVGAAGIDLSIKTIVDNIQVRLHNTAIAASMAL
jgi:hypothetical protein